MTMIPEALSLLFQIRMELRLGKSLSVALDHITSGQVGRLGKAIRTWLIRTEAGHLQSEITKTLPLISKSVAHSSLVRVLERGLRGLQIDPALAELESEFFMIAENRFERELQLLPLKLMVPLTLLILPGVMLLILGPVFFRLMTAL
jgi:hypothetical protein